MYCDAGPRGRQRWSLRRRPRRAGGKVPAAWRTIHAVLVGGWVSAGREEAAYSRDAGGRLRSEEAQRVSAESEDPVFSSTQDC